MAIFDERDRMEKLMDENLKNMRSNLKLCINLLERGLNILVFYTKVVELSEILAIKMGCNDMICLLR